MDIEHLYQEEQGFTKVIEVLIKAKKPIIGHNMIYDACFIFQQFLQDLPESYTEFADIFNSHFP